jgi:hypothetical protein
LGLKDRTPPNGSAMRDGAVVPEARSQVTQVVIRRSRQR